MLVIEEERTYIIVPKEKEKIVEDLRTWIFMLDDQNDSDMLYQLTDMKTDWEEGVDWDKIDLE